MSRTFACLCLTFSAVAAHASTLVDGNSRLMLGRYTTAEAEPAKSMFEPLDLVAQITFPREHIVNVGDAVEHTLLRTGYALVERSALSPDAARFLQLPLPEAQRVLGPFSVQAILDVLVGPAWNWHRDNVNRKVWFTLAKEYSPGPRKLQPIEPLTATGTAGKE